MAGRPLRTSYVIEQTARPNRIFALFCGLLHGYNGRDRGYHRASEGRYCRTVAKRSLQLSNSDFLDWLSLHADRSHSHLHTGRHRRPNLVVYLVAYPQYQGRTSIERKPTHWKTSLLDVRVSALIPKLGVERCHSAG